MFLWVLCPKVGKISQTLAEQKPHVTHDCYLFCYKEVMLNGIGPPDELKLPPIHSSHFLLTSFQLLIHRPWPLNLDSGRRSFLSFPGSVFLRSNTGKMSDYPSPLKGKRPQSRRWGGVPVAALLLLRRSRRSTVFRRNLTKSLPRNWTLLRPADGSDRLSWSSSSSSITAYSRFALYIFQQLDLWDSLFWSFDQNFSFWICVWDGLFRLLDGSCWDQNWGGKKCCLNSYFQ